MGGIFYYWNLKIMGNPVEFLHITHHSGIMHNNNSLCSLINKRTNRKRIQQTIPRIHIPPNNPGSGHGNRRIRWFCCHRRTDNFISGLHSGQ